MASLVPSQSDEMAGHGADVTSAGPSANSGVGMFTCLSCSIAYANPEDQRAHYRTDLHRYNMKRRVASLPPVRADVFNAKIAERRVEEEEQKAQSGGAKGAASTTSQDRCRACHKTFSSVNAYHSHLNSKRHKEMEAREASTASSPSSRADGIAAPGPESSDPLIVRIPHSMGLNDVSDVAKALPDVRAEDKSDKTAKAAFTPMALHVSENATEEEIQAAIDAKVASSKRIDPTESCIFCSASNFASLADSVQHMTRSHGFFIPEREYLTDEEGLLKYLADKVCVGNLCLYCNGKGRGFTTGDAVRKHMIDKSHCKVAYDREEDKLELSDFYDFRSSYPDAQWEDVSDDGDGFSDEGEAVTESEHDSDEELDADDSATSGVRYGDNEFELVLPSGVRLGHRSLRRFYNQSLRPTGSAYTSNSTSGREVAHRLNQQERLSRDQTLVENRGGHLVRARNRGEAREAKKHISTYRDMSRREQFKTQIGFKNNSQKHFRDPLLQ